jgi:hypothetical protein
MYDSEDVKTLSIDVLKSRLAMLGISTANILSRKTIEKLYLDALRDPNKKETLKVETAKKEKPLFTRKRKRSGNL